MRHAGPLPPAAQRRARPLRPARVGRLPPRPLAMPLSVRRRTSRRHHRRNGRRSRFFVVDPKGVRPRRSRGT